MKRKLFEAEHDDHRKVMAGSRLSRTCAGATGLTEVIIDRSIKVA